MTRLQKCLQKALTFIDVHDKPKSDRHLNKGIFKLEDEILLYESTAHFELNYINGSICLSYIGNLRLIVKHVLIYLKCEEYIRDKIINRGTTVQ